MDDFASFARLLEALRPWLNHLVVVGGWAHRLYRFHERANPPAYGALRTRDADVAFSITAPLDGDIAAALRSAGFHEEHSFEHAPPITRYHLGAGNRGFYAEFLVPLRGSRRTRRGRLDVTVGIAGLSAQKVRHLDMLLVEPWVVRLSNNEGVPVPSPLDVMIPNPASFIAQKILVRKDRARDKQAQDALYIHDTLELFGGELASLRTLWRDHVGPALHQRGVKSVERLCREQYGAVGDVIRNAALLPQDRIISPSRVQAVCMYGLDAIFAAESRVEREVP